MELDCGLLKSEKMRAVLRVRAKLLEAVRNWFKHCGYTEVQTPILVPASQELEPSSFTVQYFGKKAHLAQGACPHLEAMMILLGKVYAITPAFRAEKSPTKKHLAEHWRIECLAPKSGLEDIMQVQESLVASICLYLSEEASEELNILDRDLSSIKTPFPRIGYDEAINLLRDDGTNIFWGQSIETEQEEHLSKKSDRPFFISHYPLDSQTLFFKSHPQETELALVADLIAPEGYGEIATSGQMIDRAEELLKKMKIENIDEKTYRWHLNLKRSTSFTYSGFAIGLERLLMWICGLEHIKETTLFPRSFQLGSPFCFLKNTLTCSR